MLRFNFFIVTTCLVCCCGVARTENLINSVSLDMRYKILLPGKTSKIKLVVLIPRTIENRQRVRNIYYSIRPSHVYDVDGNPYAEFIFTEPKWPFELGITLNAELYRYDLSSVVENGFVTTKAVGEKKYLQEETYLEKNHERIAAIATKLNGRNEIDTIKKIYDFVLGTMEYGGYNPDNVGAVKALELKKGDCTEYTDLMVTLCRAKNIAARHTYGYTTEFGDTPKHSWVEVYTADYGWVPFDPTLGDSRKAAFDRLKPIYIYFSTIRNDEQLNNYQYFAYWYWGDAIKVEDTFTVRQKGHGE